MNEYILLMHDDVPERGTDAPPLDWAPYFGKLRASGRFCGGSAIGEGTCFRKNGSAPPATRHLSGYIRVQAENLEAAEQLVSGNPVYEAGGTVEVRELPRT